MGRCISCFLNTKSFTIPCIDMYRYVYINKHIETFKCFQHVLGASAGDGLLDGRALRNASSHTGDMTKWKPSTFPGLKRNMPISRNWGSMAMIAIRICRRSARCYKHSILVVRSQFWACKCPVIPQDFSSLNPPVKSPLNPIQNL